MIMKRITNIILTLLIPAATLTTHAARPLTIGDEIPGAQTPSGTLTLSECRSRALQYNKTLSSSRLQIQKQESELKAMKTNFLPNIQGFATDFYNTSKINIKPDFGSMFSAGIANAQSVLSAMASTPFAPIAAGIMSIANGFTIPEDAFQFKVGNVFAAGVGLVQPLYMGGKITAGYRMNKVGLSIAQQRVRLTEQEVLLNTDQAYVLCVRAKEMGQVARSYQALLLELQKNVESAVRHGMRTKNDALKVQVKLNEAELNIMKADNAYRLAQMNLAQVVGLPLTQRIEVTTDELYVPVDDILSSDSAGITQRPEYAMLADKTELARLQVKLTRSDFLPTLALFGGYTYMNGLKFMDKRLLDHGSATVGVMLRVPIFHFFEGTHKVRSAKAAYQISQLERDELNEKMQLELLQAANMLHEAQMEVTVTNKSVEQAEENMRLSKRAYEVGSEPLSDYLESQALWQNAQASAVEARCNYLIACTKYNKALGR